MAISRSVLASADRGHILKATAGLGKKAIDKWLAGNPLNDCTLPRDWRQVQSLPTSDIVDVLAAAAPNHCIDGWSYVARALSAFLAGDQHAARHLAYYAQLRAALCMLASMGIGVFNGINLVVDANGAVQRVDPASRPKKLGAGTHSAVWDLLETWVSMPQTARVFLEMVKISNTSLASCLDIIWPGSSATVVAKPLIEAWGMDLFRGKNDHAARNRSSYNPQAFEPLPDSPQKRNEFVQDLWRLFEPAGAYRFDLLDRHLLRQVFWKHHEFLHGNRPKEDGPIATRYDDLPDTVKKIATRGFLTGQDEPEVPLIVLAARSQVMPAPPTDMISRAFHLLRAATGFAVTNFNDANVKVADGDLRPWIDPVAAAKGFWSPSAPLVEPTDLWEDVRLGLQELAASTEPAITSLHDWLRRSPVGLPVLCEADRIGIWSFSP